MSHIEFLSGRFHRTQQSELQIRKLSCFGTGLGDEMVAWQVVTVSWAPPHGVLQGLVCCIAARAGGSWAEPTSMFSRTGPEAISYRLQKQLVVTILFGGLVVLKKAACRCEITTSL